MCTDCAPSIFWNRLFWLECLHEQLHIPDKYNKLEERSFVSLSSIEMQTVAKLMSIISILINDHLLFMAAHTHISLLRVIGMQGICQSNTTHYE